MRATHWATGATSVGYCTALALRGCARHSHGATSVSVGSCSGLASAILVLLLNRHLIGFSALGLD